MIHSELCATQRDLGDIIGLALLAAASRQLATMHQP